MRNTQKIQYLAAVLVAKTLTCGWKRSQNKTSDFMRLSLYKSLDSVEVLKGIIAGFVVLEKSTFYFSVIFYPNLIQI